MGKGKQPSQYLRKPDMQKHPFDGENDRLRFGVSYTRGWMREMENRHSVHPNLDMETSFFAIYDGHEGSDTSQFCKKFLPTQFSNNERKHEELEDAIKVSYKEMDEMLQKWSVEEGPDYVNPSSGCTACVAIVKKGKVVVANAGDSRCIIFSQDKVLFSSVDHTVDVPEECERVFGAGGHIEDGYVNGVMNITRAIGDLDLKGNDKLTPEQQVIIATPDVKTLEVEEGFIVLACDGIWDSMTNLQVMQFINEHKDSEDKLSGICAKLIDKCIAPKCNADGLGCDNMSVILIELKNPVLQEIESSGMADVHEPNVDPNMEVLVVNYYRSRCSLYLTAEIVGRLEKKIYLFAKDINGDIVQTKIANVMGLQTSANYEFEIPTTTEQLFTFDDELLQICRRRENRNYKCSSDRAKVIGNILMIVKDNLKNKKKMSTRGIYYKDVTLFKTQRTVDAAIISISLMLEVTRSSLNIYASSRGLIKGPITLEGPDFSVDCESGGILGNVIPVEAPTITSITVKYGIPKVNFILVIEKEAVFMELSGLGVTRELGCILVTGRGEPDLTTRAVLCKLQKFLVGVPVFALVDRNPYGIEIYCTYKFGSKRMAHENLGYRVPNLQWIGLYPRQLLSVNKDGPHIKFTQHDNKKARKLLDKEQVSKDPKLKKELTYLVVEQIKGDIESSSLCIKDYVISAIARFMNENNKPEELN